MKRRYGVKFYLVPALVTLALAGCIEQQGAVPSSGVGRETQLQDASSSFSDTVDECVKRGVAYFKEIGSYPKLGSAPNAGRRAEDVALERCNRTLTAF